jgi:hypothetical protein
VQWLEAVLKARNPGFIIIDTIARFSGIQDFNSYGEVSRATQPFLDMRAKYGCSILLLHHNNHGDTVLGSEMFRAFTDTVLLLTKNADGQRFLRSDGQRSGIEMEATAITLDPDTHEIIAAEPKYLADQRVSEQKIIELLKATPEGMTREQLSWHGGRRAASGRAAVDALASAGIIKFSGTGAKGSPRVFYLPATDELMDYAKEKLG